ncbi:MAG: NAD(P)H-hydrate dehydratase [Gammaproteobacteria bacterium]|nr:NAD(P)H-hydrate dehydratase [Gammaproteobacteria bacterium]
MFKPTADLYQREQVRELDRIAIEDFKVPGFMLMQRAGEAAFAVLQRKWPKIKQIAVIAGKGNNAGDGYVIAKLAKKAGFKVVVLYLAKPEILTGDALLAAQECKKVRVKIEPFASALITPEAIIVDAILGTGLSGEVQSEYKQVIAQLNARNNPILAVDIPSGLDANSGNPLGIAIRADYTVTFVGAKQGLFTGQAADYCGEVFYDDLGVSDEVFHKVQAKVELLQFGGLKRRLLPRERTAHKGAFGHVLVIGGNYGMAGAVRMAAEAAARVGAGLTTVVTRPEHVAVVCAERPELMCYGVHTGAEIIALIERATVVVIGPGLGRDDWSLDLLRVISKCSKPVVIDADALNMLATYQPEHRDSWIMTPHPGEAARLLECDIAAIQRDRFASIRAIKARFGGTCVLKGSGSLVLGASDRIGVCNAGNPGMASGGMGDVLSGVIGGLVAQRLELEDAAKLGVLLHAKAADKAAAANGERGLLAMDLMPHLRKLVN